MCASCHCLVRTKTTHCIREFYFELTDVFLSLNIDINGGGVSSIFHSTKSSFQSMSSFLLVSIEEEFQGLSMLQDLS